MELVIVFCIITFLILLGLILFIYIKINNKYKYLEHELTEYKFRYSALEDYIQDIRVSLRKH